MPKPSEFEEKEFESRLVCELAREPSRFWSPGQVLEELVGADAFIAFERLHQVFGVPMRGGVFLDEPWVWQTLTNRGRGNGGAPSFRANLAIQAKRPYRYSRRQRELGVPCWKMEIDGDQQKRLEALETELGYGLLVTYACPAFDRRTELMEHTRAGELAGSTTFPAPSMLSGHKRWTYDRAGRVGVACSEPKAYREGESVPLSEWVTAAYESNDGPREPGRQLALLWRALRNAAARADVARFGEDMAATAEAAAQTVQRAEVQDWIRVAVGMRYFGVAWLIIGTAD